MGSTVNLRQTSYENNLKEVKVDDKRELSKVVDDIVYYLVTNHANLINDIEKNKMPKTLLKDEIDKYINNNRIVIPQIVGYEEVVKEVENYLWGYGVLQPLIDEKDLSDIKVIDENNTRIKRLGRRSSANIRFASAKALLNYCYMICIKNGGSLSQLNAMQKLTDSTSQKDTILRINVCISPVNSKSPSIVIRKQPKEKATYEDLMNKDMFNLEMYIYLRKAIESGLNIVWTGKGASGKSTCMNGGLDYVPEDQSQLIMQESEELVTNHPDTIMQKVSYKTGESDVEYTLREETTNALLMDLDRMVIGEIKGAEAMDFFNAVYTGHIGWTSVHSPSAKQCPNKIVHLMKYSGTDLSREDLLEMLSEIDLIIYMKNFKCAELYEVAGFDYEKNELIFNPIFKFIAKKDKSGVSEGYFKKVGESCEKVKRKFAVADIKLQ